MWYIFSLAVFNHESLLHTDIRIRYRRNIYCQMKWMHLIQYLIFLKYVWNSRIHKKWTNNFFSNNEEERRHRNKYSQWNIGNMSSIDSFSVRSYITCAAFLFDYSFKFIYFFKSIIFYHLNCYLRDIGMVNTAILNNTKLE